MVCAIVYNTIKERYRLQCILRLFVCDEWNELQCFIIWFVLLSCLGKVRLQLRLQFYYVIYVLHNCDLLWENRPSLRILYFEKY